MAWVTCLQIMYVTYYLQYFTTTPHYWGTYLFTTGILSARDELLIGYNNDSFKELFFCCHWYMWFWEVLNNLISVIKQLLDEVEHDIMNYQNRGLCYLPQPSASADNTDLGFDYSWYHAKTEFNNCFFIHFSHNSSSETEAKRSTILFLRTTLQGA